MTCSSSLAPHFLASSSPAASILGVWTAASITRGLSQRVFGDAGVYGCGVCISWIFFFPPPGSFDCVDVVLRNWKEECLG